MAMVSTCRHVFVNLKNTNVLGNSRPYHENSYS